MGVIMYPYLLVYLASVQVIYAVWGKAMRIIDGTLCIADILSKHN